MSQLPGGLRDLEAAGHPHARDLADAGLVQRGSRAPLEARGNRDVIVGDDNRHAHESSVP